MRRIPGAVALGFNNVITSQALEYYTALAAGATATLAILPVQYAPVVDVSCYATEGAAAGTNILRIDWYVFGSASGNGSTPRLWRQDLVNEASLLAVNNVRVPNLFLQLQIVEVNGLPTTLLEFQAISRNL